MSNHSRRLVWLSVLPVALLHGGLYASFLPPWGLIDEEQHLHYIQHLAERRAIPIVGQTYLSSEIVESLFTTRRFAIFHWPTPTSHDPREMGLEGHSYEGYQPPLFYMLLAPLYAVLPDDILIRLYCLRWAVVGLSLLTVWMTYGIVTQLFPQHRTLPCFAGLLLALLPERTASVSRLNNDVLLEVMATAFVWVYTRTTLEGLSLRRSQLLGLLFGLGVLTKTSMGVLVVLLPFAFWTNRHASKRQLSALWTGGIATVLILPLVARNLWLYGDLTGFTTFRALNRAFGVFSSPGITLQTVLSAALDLFRHFWVVWWKGSLATTNPVVNGFYVALALLSGCSLAGVARYLQARHQPSGWDRRAQAILMYLLAIASCAISVLISYFAGSVPVIQGRFLLPVITPIVILFSWGLWHSSCRKVVAVATLGVLLVVGALSLFGNLLPYFYYWSAFVENGVPQPHTPLGLREVWALFYPRFLSDKPAGMRAMLVWMLPLYAASLGFAGAMFGRANLSSD